MLHRQLLLLPWTPPVRTTVACSGRCKWAVAVPHPSSVPGWRWFTIRKGIRLPYADIGGPAGAVVFPDSTSTPTNTLLKFIQPISARTLATHNEESVLLLFTPSFAARLAYDPKFIQAVVERLFGNPKHVCKLRLAVAVIDRIPTPSDPTLLKDNDCPVGDIGFEGMAYHLLDKLWISEGTQDASSRVTASMDTTGFLKMRMKNQNTSGHPSSLERAQAFRHPGLEIQVPLANTVFQTEQETFLRCYTYSRERGAWSLSTTSPATMATASLRPMDHTISHQNTIRTPLIPLTVPRVIEASMGNIVRQVQKDGGVVLASTELEAAVNAYFKYTGEPPSQVHVWALVMNKKLVSQLSKDEIPLPPARLAKLTMDEVDSSSAEDKVQSKTVPSVYANLNSILRRGGRLHRVVSGGGGWGKKAGLLSIDPAVTFERYQHAEETPWSPLPSSDSDEMTSALGNPAQLGDSIQFFLASLEQSLISPQSVNVTSSDRWSLEFGAIPSTIDAIPSTQPINGNEESIQARYIPRHFGALSEKGFALARRSFDERSTAKQTQTLIDIPFSRFTRLWGHQHGNTNRSRQLHTSTRSCLDMYGNGPADLLGLDMAAELDATSKALADAKLARKQAAAALMRRAMPRWVQSPTSPEQEKLQRLRTLPFPDLVSRFLELAEKGLTLPHHELSELWRLEGFPMPVVNLLTAYCRNNAELPEELLQNPGWQNFKSLRDGAERPGAGKKEDYYKKWALVRNIVSHLDSEADANFKADVERGMEIETELEKLLQTLPDSGLYPDLERKILGQPGRFLLTPLHKRPKLWTAHGIPVEERLDLWANKEKRRFIMGRLFKARQFMHNRGNAIGATVLDSMVWLCEERAARKLADFESRRQRFDVGFGGNDLEKLLEFQLIKQGQQLSMYNPWAFMYQVYKDRAWRAPHGSGLKKRETFWEAHGLPITLRQKIKPIMRKFEEVEQEHTNESKIIEIDIGKEIREHFPGLCGGESEQSLDDLMAYPKPSMERKADLTRSSMLVPTTDKRLVRVSRVAKKRVYPTAPGEPDDSRRMADEQHAPRYEPNRLEARQHAGSFIVDNEENSLGIHRFPNNPEKLMSVLDEADSMTGQAGGSAPENDSVSSRSEWWSKPHTYAYKMMQRQQSKDINGMIQKRLSYGKSARKQGANIARVRHDDEEEDDGVDYDEIERAREKRMAERGYRQPTVRRFVLPAPASVRRMEPGLVRRVEPPLVRRVEGKLAQGVVEEEENTWMEGTGSSIEDWESSVWKHDAEDVYYPRNEKLQDRSGAGRDDEVQKRHSFDGPSSGRKARFSPEYGRRTDTVPPEKKKESSEKLKDNIRQLLANL